MIGHHPHVVHGFERHSGSLIAHSLGNLVFDQDFHVTFASAVLRTVVSEDGVLEARVLPVMIEDYRPVLATGVLAERILAGIGADSAHAAPAERLDGPGLTRVVGGSTDASLDLVREANAGLLVLNDSVVGDRLPYVEGGVAATGRIATDLLRWGSFDDHLADGVLAPGAGWALDRAVRVSPTVIDSATGELGLELASTYVSGSLLRAQARIPLVKHRFHAEDGTPLDDPATYTLRVRAERRGRGQVFARFDTYSFDDSNPLQRADSARLGRTELELPLEVADGWQEIEIEVPPGLVEGADAVMLYLGITGGTSTKVVLSDVQFLEWRDRSSLPMGVRMAIADCGAAESSLTPSDDRTCPSTQPAPDGTTAGAQSPSRA